MRHYLRNDLEGPTPAEAVDFGKKGIEVYGKQLGMRLDELLKRPVAFAAFGPSGYARRANVQHLWWFQGIDVRTLERLRAMMGRPEGNDRGREIAPELQSRSTNFLVGSTPFEVTCFVESTRDVVRAFDAIEELGEITNWSNQVADYMKGLRARASKARSRTFA